MENGHCLRSTPVGAQDSEVCDVDNVIAIKIAVTEHHVCHVEISTQDSQVSHVHHAIPIGITRTRA